MLRPAQRLAARLASAAAPPLARRFCAAPPLLRSADGATACCVREAASAGQPPTFSFFATPRTLAELGGAASFADLPPVQTQLVQGRAFAMLESAAGRHVLAAPLSGEVLRRNEALLGAVHSPRPGGVPPAPLWLLDVACEDDSEWQALQPSAD